MTQPFEVQASADGVTMLERGLAPVALNGSPCVAEALFIRIAVLQYDRRHSLRMLDRHAQTCRRPVIENGHGVLCEVQRIGNSVQRGR